MTSLTSLYSFWFNSNERDLTSEELTERSPFWFGPNAERDHKMEQEYSDLLLSISLDIRESGFRKLEDPIERVARVLLLDQIPRNIFREDSRAFSFDSLALRDAKEIVSSGDHLKFTVAERVFLYLPFEHSENIEDQRKCLELYKTMHEDSKEELKTHTENYLKYAVLHQEIVEQFGRFPHRNQVLGRKSTEEEIQFLKDGPRFGQ